MVRLSASGRCPSVSPQCNEKSAGLGVGVVVAVKLMVREIVGVQEHELESDAVSEIVGDGLTETC